VGLLHCHQVVGMGLEGSGDGQVCALTWHWPVETEENQENLMVAYVQAKIWTESCNPFSNSVLETLC
jgi:hypothetical protein